MTMCKLLPAGYLLVQKVNVDDDSGIRKYHGVDRLPPLLPADDALRTMLGEPIVEDPSVRSAIDEWFSSHSDTSAFLADLSVANRLLRLSHSFELQLELLYCEAAVEPLQEVSNAGHIPASFETGSVPLVTYGFDVSWPNCKHSAIKQPGIVPNCSEWENKLNSFGLLNTFIDAADLRRQYLQVYPYPPFDIFLVHHVVTTC